MDNNLDPQNTASQASTDLAKEYEEIIKKYQAALAQSQPQSEPQPQPQPEIQPQPVIPSQPEVQPEPQFQPEPEPLLQPVLSPPELPLSPPQPNSIESFVPPTPPVLSSESEVIPEKVNPIYKVLFFFSLLLFLGVVGAIVVSLFKDQQNTSAGSPDETESPIITIAPTKAVGEGSCVLNDKIYAVNQTFNAADGCNICTCNSDFQVTCTVNECTPTKKPTPTTKLNTTVTPKPTI